MSVEEGPLFRELAEEGGVDRLRRQRGRERQVAGGEAFREAEEIRDDALELGDRERPDPAEPVKNSDTCDPNESNARSPMMSSTMPTARRMIPMMR